MLVSISQHRLHDRALLLEDERIEQASLFPLFELSGTTRALMLTSAESSEILLIEWRPGLVERGLLRPVRLRVRREDCREDDESLGLEDLWHFDPWWELGQARYAEHPAVPLLKATNVPGYDDSLTRFWFASDLGRVTWVGSGEGGPGQVRKYAPDQLGAAVERRRRRAAPKPAPEEGRSEWRLRPFWQ